MMAGSLSKLKAPGVVPVAREVGAPDVQDFDLRFADLDAEFVCKPFWFHLPKPDAVPTTLDRILAASDSCFESRVTPSTSKYDSPVPRRGLMVQHRV